MSRRQLLWANKARAKLIERLGGACKVCGATEKLEFDCMKPCGDEHHRLKSDSRMKFYKEQWTTGNLQVLCTKCHTKKSALELGDTRRPSNPEARRRSEAWTREVGTEQPRDWVND